MKEKFILYKDSSSFLSKTLHLPVFNIGQVSFPVLFWYTKTYTGKDKLQH